MGIKEKDNNIQDKSANLHSEEEEDSESSSNQTKTINAISKLSITERANSNQTQINTNFKRSNFPYEFLKKKPIKKYRKRQNDNKDKLVMKIKQMSKRIEQLQKQLNETNRQQDLCPHCHFYTAKPSIKQLQRRDTNDNQLMIDAYKRSTSRESLQFQKIDFNLPTMYNPQMEEKTWIFLGTIMIAMGSKVLGIDGTLNVFKIVKQSVDIIRRQVQKSEDKLSMDFFLGKEQYQSQLRAQQFGFDPFYNNQQRNCGGFQLEGVRVQSVEQYDLVFDQKIRFNVNYEALITVMQYMKQKSSISYT